MARNIQLRRCIADSQPATAFSRPVAARQIYPDVAGAEGCVHGKFPFVVGATVVEVAFRDTIGQPAHGYTTVFECGTGVPPSTRITFDSTSEIGFKRLIGKLEGICGAYSNQEGPIKIEEVAEWHCPGTWAVSAVLDSFVKIKSGGADTYTCTAKAVC